MLSDAIGSFLPQALGVALSPIPIVAIVLVLNSARARTSGPAFALGWIAGLTVVSVVVVVLTGGSDEAGSTAATGVRWGLVVLGVLCLVMAAKQWRKRPRRGQETEMPHWLATVDSIAPGRALVLGVALSAANPKNLVLTMSAAAAIAQEGLGTTDTVIAIAVFVAIGSITVAGAVLFYLVAPRAAERPLAAMREFMADHSAVIMTVLLLIIGVKILGDALAG